MKTNLDVAREIVISYFEKRANKYANDGSLEELAALKFAETNELLKEHIIAMKNIFEKALEELEKGNK